MMHKERIIYDVCILMKMILFLCEPVCFCLFVCLFGFNVALRTSEVISRRYLQQWYFGQCAATQECYVCRRHMT